MERIGCAGRADQGWKAIVGQTGGVWRNVLDETPDKRGPQCYYSDCVNPRSFLRFGEQRSVRVLWRAGRRNLQ